MRLSTRASLAVLVLVGFATVAHAQGAGPFGVARPEPGFNPQDFGPFAGIIAFIAAKQAELYRLFAATIRATKTDSLAAFSLIGLTFLYGVLHAAGPGHGKAVIASYLLATRETLKRGALMSFASAMVQGASAVLIIGVFAVLLKATTASIDHATGLIETASYLLVVVIGAWLLGRTLWRMRARRNAASLSSAAVHVHLADGSCCVAPDPKLLEGHFDLKTAAAAVLAVGVRPCTGAILVLVFALSQGAFGIGLLAVLAMSIGTGITVAALASLAVGAKAIAVRLAARRSAATLMVSQGLELVGAGLIMLFGLLLLSAQLVMGSVAT